MNPEVVFHVDMDAFYASVEQLDNPELLGKPVIVGGRVSNRGVVSACSYEARAFGIHSAMPMFQAVRLCPQGVFLPGRMHRYEEVSDSVMKILGEFAPSVQQISIDEAFLGMTGTHHIYGTPLEAGRLLKQRIRETLGLTISVGIGSSKFIAKMASDYRKPDGLYQVAPGNELQFIDSLPLGKIWGLGKKTRERLHSLGLHTASQLRELREESLRSTFGESMGHYLYQAARGIDPGILAVRQGAQSISNECTFSEDISSGELLCRYLLDLSHQVMFRCIDKQVTGYTVFIKIKLATFETTTAQATLPDPVLHAEQLYSHARELLLKRWDRSSPIRLLGVGLSSLVSSSSSCQKSLFQDQEADLKKQAVEQAVFKIKKRGNGIGKASGLMRGFDKKS